MNTEKLSNEAVKPSLSNGVVIPRFYYRITNAFKVGLWAFRNPYSLKESNFKILSDLFGLIMKVATEDRHMMTHIAYVHPEEGEKQIVSIWAGAGMGAEPTKRIAELLKENSMLKAQLSKYVAPQNEA
jgi:hypothetical protein